MIINYHNIKFNFSALQLKEEFEGECYAEFPKDVVLAAKEYIEVEEFSGYVVDLFMENLEDYTTEEEFFSTSDADLIIALVTYIVEEYKKPVEIDIEYSDIIWLFHDLTHSENDCIDFDMSVYDYSEQLAYEGSIDKMMETGLPIPFNILADCEKSYKKRFGVGIGLVDYAKSLIKYPKEVTLV